MSGPIHADSPLRQMLPTGQAIHYPSYRQTATACGLAYAHERKRHICVTYDVDRVTCARCRRALP